MMLVLVYLVEYARLDFLNPGPFIFWIVSSLFYVMYNYSAWLNVAKGVSSQLIKIQCLFKLLWHIGSSSKFFDNHDSKRHHAFLGKISSMQNFLLILIKMKYKVIQKMLMKFFKRILKS